MSKMMCHCSPKLFHRQIKASSPPVIIIEYFRVRKIYCAWKIFIHEVTENLSSFAKLPLVVKHIVNFNEN